MEINVVGAVVSGVFVAGFGLTAYFIRRAHKKNKWDKGDPTPGPVQTFVSPERIPAPAPVVPEKAKDVASRAPESYSTIDRTVEQPMFPTDSGFGVVDLITTAVIIDAATDLFENHGSPDVDYHPPVEPTPSYDSGSSSYDPGPISHDTGSSSSYDSGSSSYGDYGSSSYDSSPSSYDSGSSFDSSSNW
jgi:hypothetical protein